ncbi:MAG TPA: EthD family reductase [Trueperaceae bacterium]|nr:EthD family reductase [Trueperaceae bacterium]
MIKLIALYKRPDDLDAFMRHYREVHTPLARRLPGLQQMVVNTVTADAFGKEAELALIAEMHFADRDAFNAAMRSDANKALAEDLAGFAGGLATVLVTDSEEVA